MHVRVCGSHLSRNTSTGVDADFSFSHTLERRLASIAEFIASFFFFHARFSPTSVPRLFFNSVISNRRHEKILRYSSRGERDLPHLKCETQQWSRLVGNRLPARELDLIPFARCGNACNKLPERSTAAKLYYPLF